MKRIVLFLLLSIVVMSGFCQKKSKSQNTPYYPDKEWIHKQPEETGVDSQKLKEAIDFAITHETKSPRSMEQNHYQTFGREPFGDAIGPMKDRGAPTGVIIKNGYIIAEWGEPLQQ